jgi:hypothetical protein
MAWGVYLVTPTYDEQLEHYERHKCAILRGVPRSPMATWRLMGCYLGEIGEWFILAMGNNIKEANDKGKSHRAHLETEGPDNDLIPREVPYTRMERWYWGEWRVFEQK